jgi:hypothetical protein
VARVTPKSKVADFCAAQWPDFTPPLTGMAKIKEFCRISGKMVQVILNRLNSLFEGDAE